MLSDTDWELASEPELPAFTIEGDEYLKRLTMVVSAGRIEHVFYQIFPPDEHASEVLEWVKENPDR